MPDGSGVHTYRLFLAGAGLGSRGVRVALAPFLSRVCSSVGQSTRLISVGSMVQIHPDPPFIRRGCSSVGRAPALQAGGHRFDPVHLHHQLQSSILNAHASREHSVFDSMSRPAVTLFNNTEEVKVSVRSEPRERYCPRRGRIGILGKDCIVVSGEHTKGLRMRQTRVHL